MIGYHDFVPADTETAGEPGRDETDAAEEDFDRMMAEGTPVQIVTEPPCTFGAGGPAPRRSPSAVAYTLQDGAQYEILVSGDATVRYDDGLLIIHHTQSLVAGIIQIKPWEN